ncbi:2-(3-amino-3-carboxypropyl)histidine synthase ASCRUDRAFT_79101 [Ascoidea rubescens DSM 1968]|uniref:2-(3-amino-3-carboxypropyl)histidine synthase subunit 1 n=1 Tax=Ascoidea rubescens DSM 1968 TaxID=1344418 RepID=A0A1D2VRG9_9ASCO|nr:hypothetical protein ASCRUDRAFT_79101 [Ascoidea rubescens DSM 1968]ODV64204.1 hypothetical protein ASCRUDRAFT_79101 [Ascoidea rubescens DSM 1968]
MQADTPRNNLDSEIKKKRIPKRRFIGHKTGSDSHSVSTSNDSDFKSLVRRTVKTRRNLRLITHIPKDILENKEINEAIKLLPSNYNFEIHKTIWNIRKNNSKRVALQMPEGLLIYSLIISDILEQFCECEVIVMGDVSYGACCIDDYTARSLGCDFIIHYAHSCLVPVDITLIKVLYIFVTININEKHLISTIKRNFQVHDKLALFGTIQFNPTLHLVRQILNEENYQIITPQILPLSKGEVLGCTSTKLDENEIKAMIYIGDGRFHLESSMIHNPNIPAFRYDPYSKKFTQEYYEIKELIEVRSDAIKSCEKCEKFGLIIGSLGRQGNLLTIEMIEKVLKENNKTVIKIILSEIFPQKLSIFDDIDCFIQVACPRLSIDWGYAFDRPLLTPYEAMVLFEKDKGITGDYYPMDYYAKDGYGRGKTPLNHHIESS